MTENEPSVNPVDYPTPWQEYAKDIYAVVIGEGITSISPFSFANCENIIRLDIGESVTAIREYAFYSCSLLECVVFPKEITELYPYSFAYCTSLTSLSLPDGVTKIGECAFEDCKSLETINIKDNQIQEVGYRAFFGCTSLTELPVGNSTKIIGHSAFNGCESIETVTFPDSIESVGVDAFYGCSSITYLQWPGHLQEVPMHCFAECTSLETVIIPDGVTEIGPGPFVNCTNLKNITLGKDIHTLDGCFAGCISLENIELPEALTTIEFRTFARTSLKTLEIPENVSHIGSFAFTGCNALTNINLPSGIKVIENGAFQDCQALTSIQLPSGITKIESDTFKNCQTLTSIQLPSGITQIGDHAFENCSALTSMNMPEELVSLGYRVFSDCEMLKEIHLNAKLKEIGEWCFSGCDQLQQIRIPESVTAIGKYAFFGNGLLSKVDLGNGALKKIGHSAFEHTLIETIEIPQNVTEIEGYAFSRCTSLQGVVIRGDAVTIGERAFYECSGLKLIMFKGQKGEIANDAFQGITAKASYPLSPRWKEIPEETDYGATYILWIDEFRLKSSNAMVEPGVVLELINSIKLESVYSFSNTGETVDGEYFVPVYGLVTDASREEVLAVYDSVGLSGKDGLCSGFTLTAASFNEYSRPFFGAKKLGQYSKTDRDGKYWRTVWDWIKYGWVYANGSETACYEININMDKCDEIYKKVNAYQQGSGDPVLIDIAPGNMEDGSLHSLWALGIGEEEEGRVDLIVYDPNYPETYKTLTLFKENGVISKNWEYQYVDDFGWSSSKGGHISYTEIADDFAYWTDKGMTAENVPWSGDYSQYLTANHSGLILKAEIEDIHSKKITIRQKLSGKREETVEQIVDGTADKITMAVEEVFKYVMPKLGLLNTAENDGGGNDSVEYWMNVGDTYTILNPTDSVIKYSTSTPNSGVVINLPAGATAETTVSEDKPNGIKFTLTGNQKITFTYLDATSDGSNVNKLKITAQGSSQITSTQQTDGVSVTGASELVIGEGGDSGTFKNLNSSETYIIKGINDSSDTRNMTVVNGKTGETIFSEKEVKEKINQPIGDLPQQGVKVSAIHLACLSKKIAAGKKVAIQATVLPENAANQTLTWKSSNTKVAVVNSKGVVTFRKKTGGKTVTITARTVDGSNVSASVKLTSMKGIVKKISISGKKTVKAGKAIQLKAKIRATPKANKTLCWSSSNPAYAAVNAKGKVTANKKAKGKKVRITARATDGSGKKKTITIKIK